MTSLKESILSELLEPWTLPVHNIWTEIPTSPIHISSVVLQPITCPK